MCVHYLAVDTLFILETLLKCMIRMIFFSRYEFVKVTFLTAVKSKAGTIIEQLDEKSIENVQLRTVETHSPYLTMTTFLLFSFLNWNVLQVNLTY